MYKPHGIYIRSGESIRWEPHESWNTYHNNVPYWVSRPWENKPKKPAIELLKEISKKLKE